MTNISLFWGKNMHMKYYRKYKEMTCTLGWNGDGYSLK